MSYHNIPSSTRQSRTNAEGQNAPAGYHYMPDGTLMSNAEHARLYPGVSSHGVEASKVIKNFNLDLSPLPAESEKRKFTIIGDKDAEFILEIKNEDNYYYNFTTNLFQVAQTRLEKVIKSKTYEGLIIFPTVEDQDQYDIFLYAKPGTAHRGYKEVRFKDRSLDINSSSGSNSLMMQKVIYQYMDITLTIQPYSPNSVTDLIKSSTRVDDTVVTSMGSKSNKTPFRIACEVNAATKSYQIKRQPTDKDFLALTTLTVDATPETLPGENIYPTARAAFTGDDVNGAVTSGVVVTMDNTDLSEVIAVGDKVTATTSYDDVDGAVVESNRVVMDNNVAENMAVGDQVTSALDASALNETVITVAALNPDGDNAKEFSLSEAVEIADDERLIFSSRVNRELATVTAVETGGAGTDFTLSLDDVQFRDNQELTFTPQKNYQWSVDNIDKLKKGMTLLAGANVTADSATDNYEDSITILEGTEEERKIIKNKRDFKDDKSQVPTMVRGLVTAQAGNIVFNKQQVLAFGGGTQKLLAYGIGNILSAYDHDVRITDLRISLTPIKTTTTSSTVGASSTSVVVASRNGILDNVSTVSGIGINPNVLDPTVVSGAGAVSGAGTIVLSAAQELESGITLDFAGAGQVATITGNIEVLKAGTANQTIYIDMEKLLSIT